MSVRRQQYLQWMGIDYWRVRHAPPDIAKSVSVDAGVSASSWPETDWQALQQQVAVCTACPLHCSRTRTVFGTGNPQAKLMFIGEAPGAEEDRQGKPFVGRAGQLLTQMLRAIHLTREEVFIANILKCRPPNNRDPQSAEVQQCTPYLQRQIEFIQPKLLVALGRVSAHFLLRTTTPLGKLRHQIFHWGKTHTPLMVTYHPAYLLRSPQDKAKSYVDLLQIKKMLNDA